MSIQVLIDMIADVETLVESDCTWEYKYDRAFCQKKTIDNYMSSMGLRRLNYYDPDTSYEDDVRAYLRALLEVKTNLEKEQKAILQKSQNG